jgi:hypothetical protein
MNRTRMFTMFLLTIALTIGCGNQGGQQSASPSEPTVVSGDNKDYPGLTWETLSGTLAGGYSGAMGKYATTWDKNCWFGMIIPEGAIDPLSPPINFVMSWPTKSSYLAHPEISRRLILGCEPDGQHFQVPITIVATWMPWENSPPPPNPCPILSSDGDTAWADVTYNSTTRRYRLQFQVTHFSDWESDIDPNK